MRVFVIISTFCMIFLKTASSTAETYDCRADPSAENVIDISETDPVDTILVMFNNSFGNLRWTASVNGSSKSYLSLFLKSTMGDDIHALELAKILDLELLQLELSSSSQLFIETTYDVVTLDLSVFCDEEPGISNEWKFKLNIRSVNEFYPQFMGSPFKAAIKESAALGTEIFNIGVRATDLDAGQSNLTFTIAPYMITQFDGSRYVKLDYKDPGSIVVARLLDFEAFLASGRTYMFVNVTATDEGGFTSATSINVTVTDRNDQGIQLLYPGCARPCLTANFSALTNESYIGRLELEPVAIYAEDLDTLNDSIIYSLVSDADREFFDIISTTGILFKTAPLVNDSYGFTIPVEVRAQETTNEEHFLNFNVTVLISERMPKTVSWASITGHVSVNSQDHDARDNKQRGNDYNPLVERLDALENLLRESVSKIKSLEQTVKSQNKQLKKQAHELKGLDFIVHKHRARVQTSSERARMNRLRIFRLRDLLVGTGLMKKRNVNKEALLKTVYNEELWEQDVHTDESDVVKQKHASVADSEVQNEMNNKESNRNCETSGMTENGKKEDLENRRHGSKANTETFGGVAFSVYLDHDLYFDTHQTIKFNQIITNEGNGYDKSIGVFRCPKGGVYMFSFFIGQRREEVVPRRIKAELNVNSDIVMEAMVDSHSSLQDKMGGNIVVIRINRGDVVYVDSLGGNGSAEGSANLKLTSFSGVYLYP